MAQKTVTTNQCREVHDAKHMGYINQTVFNLYHAAYKRQAVKNTLDK